MPQAAPSRPGDHKIYKLSVGASYTGAQLRYAFDRAWSGEARYQRGEADSEPSGRVIAHSLGIRAYRHFRGQGAMSFYLGAETAFISADSQAADFRGSGGAAGAFVGLEYSLARRLFLGLDMGPYFISLKDKTAATVSAGGVDFIANASVNFHVF